VPRVLTLTTVVTGTELNVNDGDVLVVTFTATGTPPPLSGCSVRLKFTFTG
jgi:hypothetical protein